VAVVLVCLRLPVPWEQELLVKVMTAVQAEPVLRLHLAALAVVVRVAELVLAEEEILVLEAAVALAHPHLSLAPQSLMAVAVLVRVL
jgi:hypothetical protein